MLGFDESDEEMLDLLTAAPIYPVDAGGQFPVAGDARVGSFEPMDSGVWGDSFTVEVPEESVDEPLGQVGMEVEMPEEHPYD